MGFTNSHFQPSQDLELLSFMDLRPLSAPLTK